MSSILLAQNPYVTEKARFQTVQQNNTVNPNAVTEQKVELTWSEYLQPTVTFEASTQVIYPKTCRQWVIVTSALAVPLLTLGFAWYATQTSN